MKRVIFNIILIFYIIFITAFPSYADDIDEDIENSIIDEEVLDVAVKLENTKEPDIVSRNVVVIDRNYKKVLLGKNENKRTSMASTTKIMTSIILLEELEKQNDMSLTTTVEVCKKAANIGGSRLGLHTGDRITLNDLLYGLMLRSGNDAAIQIAVTISGSVEEFAELMNKKALELGLKDTHFVTPHGLDNEEHYTTPYELAIITDYALNISKISEVVKTKVCTVNINGYAKTITNTNELLGYLDGVNGVKTGFTNNAGRCLVTSVNRNGFEIITVVLGADAKKIRTKDSIKLIEYIYSNYELINIKEIIEEEFNNWMDVKRIKVDKGINKFAKVMLEKCNYEAYPIKTSEPYNITVDIISDNILKAPILKGEKVGILNVKLGDEIIGKIDILIKEDISKKQMENYLLDIFENIKKRFE